MHVITVLLRVALSAVFGAAGVTKLFDQPGTRDAAKNFGVAESLAPAFAMALPIAELAIAAGLLFANTTLASAIAGVLLLGAFVVAIGVNLARGRTHDCHCFGQLYSRPLGWPTLVRNIVFALAAGFVFWETTIARSPNIVSTLAALGGVGWGLLITGVAIILALFLYIQHRHRLALAAEVGPAGLPLDSIAPDFE